MRGCDVARPDTLGNVRSTRNAAQDSQSAGGWAPYPTPVPEHRDDETGGYVLRVADQRFRVQERPLGDRHFEYRYTWLTGPNPGYGFTAAGPVKANVAEHRAAIGAFLADIDPATGYLRED